MVKPQVIKRVDQVVKVVLVVTLIGMIVAVTVALTGCKPAGQRPAPVRTAVQVAPSWRAGMEPGCFTVGEPVAPECLEGGAPTCPYDSTTVGPCWATAPDGRIWYRP